MTIRLYLEEDSMRHALVQGLRAQGIDVMTALEAGLIECNDQKHLDYATAHSRVLYSFNVRDFYRIHSAYMAEGKSHAGIILARQQRHPLGEQLRLLLKLSTIRSLDDMRNRVEFLGSMKGS